MKGRKGMWEGERTGLLKGERGAEAFESVTGECVLLLSLGCELSDRNNLCMSF